MFRPFGTNNIILNILATPTKAVTAVKTRQILSTFGLSRVSVSLKAIIESEHQLIYISNSDFWTTWFGWVAEETGREAKGMESSLLNFIKVSHFNADNKTTVSRIIPGVERQKEA